MMMTLLLLVRHGAGVNGLNLEGARNGSMMTAMKSFQDGRLLAC